MAREGVVRGEVILAVLGRCRQADVADSVFQMEKYFVLLAFAAYVDEEDGGATGRTFAAWLEVCREMPRFPPSDRGQYSPDRRPFAE
jgi:hypothetical protein